MMTNKDWVTWLNEPIYTDAGIHNIQKRKYAIYIFLTEGILPFIHSAGYRFRHNTKIMTRLLLSALYFYSTDFQMPIYRHSIPNLKDRKRLRSTGAVTMANLRQHPEPCRKIIAVKF